jgi:nicotinamide mononucleotide transporter
VITVNLLYSGLSGDMMINGYFTIMSIYGWYKWTRKVKTKTAYQSQGLITEKIIDRTVFVTIL